MSHKNVSPPRDIVKTIGRLGKPASLQGLIHQGILDEIASTPLEPVELWPSDLAASIHLGLHMRGLIPLQPYRVLGDRRRDGEGEQQ